MAVMATRGDRRQRRGQRWRRCGHAATRSRRLRAGKNGGGDDDGSSDGGGGDGRAALTASKSAKVALKGRSHKV